MQYEPGQRVALVHTSDPHTELHPGDEGTVRRYDAVQRRVDVTWDGGSTLSMLLDDGDAITAIPTAVPTDQAAPDSPARSADPAAPGGAWPALLDAVRTVGAADGTSAAEWWLQDTIGGRASGDSAAAARRILDGIDDEDPAVLDTFPAADADWLGTSTTRHHLADQHGRSTPLTADQWRQAQDAYRDGYTAAVTDTIAAACRRQLHPTGDDRDLSHLHPDRVTLGSVGVFSGDWNDAGVMAAHRLTAGYVGTLIDRWNGWAVFTCTKAVAEAIVADQQQICDAYRVELAAAGVPEADLDRQTDEAYTRLWWDGDVIVVDSSTRHDDPSAAERIEPDEQGRYVVMGWSWCWETVDPYDCARIVGDLPDPDASQEWRLLTHAPYTRVGPQPYTIGGLVGMGPDEGLAGQLYAGTEAVATVVEVIAPSPAASAAQLTATTGTFDAESWQAFVAAGRRRGEPMTEAAVLDALAEETQLDMLTAEATATGGTLARLLDDTGTILHLERVHPAPGTPETFHALQERLRTSRRDSRGVTWQYWNGRSWRHLTNAADTDQSRTHRGTPTT